MMLEMAKPRVKKRTAKRATATPKKTTKKRSGKATLKGAPAPIPAADPADRFKLFDTKEIPKGWAQADDVFDRVMAVPTIFLSFNRATRVGGLPVRRITTLHGKTHGGKTAFALGLLKSFVDGGHLSAYVDAEHATPAEFLIELLGQLKGKPNFLGKRPKSYEETIDSTDAFLKYAEELIKKSPSMCSFELIDSINKLVPERELKNVQKTGAEELAKGHLGRARAATNQAWLDHLVPRLGNANCALVLIAQERKVATTSKWEDDWALKGGGALAFDSSLLCRVLKSSPVKDGSGGPIVGFRHRVRIYKSKVGHMDGKYTDCFFHLSSGALEGVPPGFDLGRDAIELGLELGTCTLQGAWIGWMGASGKRIRRNGHNACVKFLAKHPDEFAHLFDAVTRSITAERLARGTEFDPAEVE